MLGRLVAGGDCDAVGFRAVDGEGDGRRARRKLEGDLDGRGSGVEREDLFRKYGFLVVGRGGIFLRERRLSLALKYFRRERGLGPG